MINLVVVTDLTYSSSPTPFHLIHSVAVVCKVGIFLLNTLYLDHFDASTSD